MSSKLSTRKSEAEFETDDTVFDQGKQRQVVVKLKPKFLELRLKGRRQMVPVSLSYAGMYMKAALVAAGAGNPARK